MVEIYFVFNESVYLRFLSIVCVESGHTPGGSMESKGREEEDISAKQHQCQLRGVREAGQRSEAGLQFEKMYSFCEENG